MFFLAARRLTKWKEQVTTQVVEAGEFQMPVAAFGQSFGALESRESVIKSVDQAHASSHANFGAATFKVVHRTVARFEMRFAGSLGISGFQENVAFQTD